ncbi:MULTISPECIES: hypothetical protein [Enterococcus]|uniref:hypothetical protein n=1 Tax=Enterococcus TaxID=1350 RepID=UPI00064C55B1|nr:hypothetical protein [Enterococcus faecium]MDQ8513145.1 hypothetical protein [Enterococcus faecium]NTK47813.1 hypothetical protein [Enterococcus faecium]NVD33568.1 hypothetical protein [Enterococcus faecium]NVD81233.1 hypothetical protein [Enterococcus faecium]NVE87929.1 hypothetical protein [Enterococcus faecium]
MAKTEENKNCFIITPIGNDNGPERRFADGITDAVLRPVLNEFDLKPVAAHDISATGSINDQVIQHIYEDKLAICNLTGLNPNVMYELGVRFTMRKHTILICEEGIRLPFDIIAERTIFYKNDIAGSEELKDKLRRMIKGIDYTKDPENPIFKVLTFDQAMGNIETDDPSNAILKKLQELIQNNSTTVNTGNNLNIPYTAILEKLDGDGFTKSDFKTLALNIKSVSSNNVYITSSQWTSSQKVWAINFYSRIPFESAVEIISQIISNNFHNKVELMFLNNFPFKG